MALSNVLRRSRNMIFSPQAEWRVIAAENSDYPRSGLLVYVLLLASIGPCAYGIGIWLFGINMGGGSQASPLAADSPMGSAISSFVFNPNLSISTGEKAISTLLALRLAMTTYALSLLTVTLLGLVLYLLAPLMSGQRNFRNALRTAIYSSTPAWTAAVCLILPTLFIILVIGMIYSLYIMPGGTRLLLNVPESEAAMLVGVTVFCLLLLSQVIGYLASALGFSILLL